MSHDEPRIGIAPSEAVEIGERKPRLLEVVGSIKGMFRRRWLTFLLVTVGVAITALVLILLIAPRYEAVTRIRIDPLRNPLAASQGEALASLSSEAIDTQVAVLQSSDLAREVVRRLSLQNDPEFTRGLEDLSGRDGGEERLTAVTNRVIRQLNVGRERLTYIIVVQFASHDPVKAARIANAFADTYLDLRVDSGVGTAERQAQWFQQRLSVLGREVSEAEARVAQYRASAGIAGGTSTDTITDQQIAPLSTQLASAESEAAEARSNLAVAQTQIARGGLDAVSEVRTSPVVADLRRQRAEVLRNQGEIAARYGDRHPETLRVRDQLNALDQQIREEAERAIGSLRAAASASEARVASLRGSLAQLRGQQSRDIRATGSADSLEREANTRRAAYDRMAQLSLQSTQGAQNSIAQAEIVERATPPERPTKPNKQMLALLALVVALGAGLAVIIILEMLSSGLRSVADVESRFGLPVLASVPKIQNRRLLRGLKTPADLVVRQPASAYSESLRNTGASLFGVRGGTGVQVVAFTSALPGEGKTTASLSLARVLAMAGTHTLLIDCDLRRASLAGITVGCPEIGLVDVLMGNATPQQAVVKDEVAHLDMITVREPTFEAQHAFGEAFVGVLDWARKEYSAVVLDLPPILGVADSRAMAAAADRVALIIKWNSTPAKAVETALAILNADDAPLAGAIYTMVSPRAEGVGGLSYAEHYSAYYQQD